jgi:hypothetical protein
MQYGACRVESDHLLAENKSTSMLALHNTSYIPMQAILHPTSSGSNHFWPTPIDLSAAHCHLSPEECQKWVDEGHCLYCDGFNHLAYECPNKPNVPS